MRARALTPFVFALTFAAGGCASSTTESQPSAAISTGTGTTPSSGLSPTTSASPTARGYIPTTGTERRAANHHPWRFLDHAYTVRLDSAPVDLATSRTLVRRSLVWMKRFQFKANRYAGTYMFSDTEIAAYTPLLTGPAKQRLVRDIKVGDKVVRPLVKQWDAGRRPSMSRTGWALDMVRTLLWLNGFPNDATVTAGRARVYGDPGSPHEVFVAVEIHSSRGFNGMKGRYRTILFCHGWTKTPAGWRLDRGWFTTPK